MKKSTRIASYIAIFGVVFSTGLLAGNTLPTRSLVTPTGNAQGSVLGDLLGLDQPTTSGDLDLRTMWTVRDLLEKKYIHTEKLNKGEMAYGAIKGMVAALDDPFTEFMDPQETVEFNESLNSELEGIGAELTVHNAQLVVVSTVKDSPAQKAGLLPDDIVLKIDDKVVENMSLYDAITNIRGQKGTAVTLTISRKSKDKPFEVKISRDKITVESVTSKEIESGIWQVAVHEFSDDTKVEFNYIIDQIKQKKPKGLVLDLRYNGGGYLEGSIDILSAFIRGQQEVVSVEYRNSKEDEKLKTTGNPQFPDLPLVVLTNKGSASASEIVIAAIQDFKRGLIMGETSFGKGTVQEVDPLPDGSSLRFTIARWNPPNGININEIGIKPDREVLPEDGDQEKGYDRQLDEAVKYLKNL